MGHPRNHRDSLLCDWDLHPHSLHHRPCTSLALDLVAACLQLYGSLSLALWTQARMPVYTTQAPLVVGSPQVVTFLVWPELHLTRFDHIDSRRYGPMRKTPLRIGPG